MKQAKFLGKSILSLFLVFCLSACAPSRIELTPEQAHRYCEAHKEETKCFTNFYHGGIYHTLEWLAEYYQKSPPYSQLLCTLQVESAKQVNYFNGQHFIELELKVTDVHLGYLSVIGKTFTETVSQDTLEVDHLVGKKYVSFLEGRNANLIYTPWLFLLTDDDILVSPYGCQIEEENRGNYISMESRSYTGQTLDYFVSKVKEAETKARLAIREELSQ